ncbi:MAG: YdcH family protein [Pyrinomonadaceae bacterium]
MDMSTSDPVRDELLKSNPTFRDLVHQHQNFEERLTQLSGLNYPSDDEQVEESTLKKKKLMVKDEIYAIMHDYEISH